MSASRTCTVSVYAPSPVMCHVSVTGPSVASQFAKSTTPPSKRKDSERSSSPRSSTQLMVRPGTRKAVWRARASRDSQEKPSVAGKIWKSAQKRTRVPVLVLFTLPTVLSLDWSVKGVKGELGVRCLESSNSPGSPRLKHIS